MAGNLTLSLKILMAVKTFNPIFSQAVCQSLRILKLFYKVLTYLYWLEKIFHILFAQRLRRCSSEEYLKATATPILKILPWYSPEIE